MAETMPASVPMECAILGALLLYPERYGEVSLTPDDFSLDSHRVIYARVTEAANSGEPWDLLTVTENLRARGELDRIGGIGYLTGLSEGIPRGMNLEHHAKRLREQAALRRAIHGAQALICQATQPGVSLADVEQHVSEIQESLQADAARMGGIRDMSEIPDPFSFDVGAVEYVVDDLIPHGALILLSGEPGIGKSYLALALAVATARSDDFLGRSCECVPVVILDRENPLALVQQRLQMLKGVTCPGLRIWGGWMKDEPPALGDSRLLTMAKQYRPLMVFDSLVRFHTADENSATDMAPVMGHLRRLADAGGTVVVLHHRTKAEGGSKYRGSSDILAAVDCAYALERVGGDLLQLHRFKSRFSAETTITLRADLSAGLFEVTDSPTTVERRDDLATIAQAITANPGITHNRLLGMLGMGRTRATNLLRANEGRLWRTESRERGALAYFPVSVSTGTTGTPLGSSTGVPVPVIPVSVSTSQYQSRRDVH